MYLQGGKGDDEETNNGRARKVEGRRRMEGRGEKRGKERRLREGGGRRRRWKGSL